MTDFFFNPIWILVILVVAFSFGFFMRRVNRHLDIKPMTLFHLENGESILLYSGWCWENGAAVGNGMIDGTKHRIIEIPMSKIFYTTSDGMDRNPMVGDPDGPGTSCHGISPISEESDDE